jgi:hypothetical protein
VTSIRDKLLDVLGRSTPGPGSPLPFARDLTVAPNRRLSCRDLGPQRGDLRPRPRHSLRRDQRGQLVIRRTNTFPHNKIIPQARSQPGNGLNSYQ